MRRLDRQNLSVLLWNPEIKGRAFARFRLNPDFSTICLHDFLRSCKTGTGARNVFAIQAAKDLKNGFLGLRLNPDAVIANRSSASLSV
jgi:hypothetical protein